MKSKITNRCLSLLLTICLVAALIPASAFAQEAAAQQTITAGQSVIKGELIPDKTEYFVGDTVTCQVIISSEKGVDTNIALKRLSTYINYDRGYLELKEVHLASFWALDSPDMKSMCPMTLVWDDDPFSDPDPIGGSGYIIATMVFTAVKEGLVELSLSGAAAETLEGERIELNTTGKSELVISEQGHLYGIVSFNVDPQFGTLVGERIAYIGPYGTGLYRDSQCIEYFDIPKFVPAEWYMVDPIYKWKDKNTGLKYTDGDIEEGEWYENKVELVPNIIRFPREMVDAEGNKTIYIFDDKGRLVQTIDPLGNVSRGEYNDKDDLISETTALGYTTRYYYDSSEHLIKKVYPDKTCDIYTYDEKGRLKSHTKPGGTREEYEYDGNDRVISTTTYDSNDELVCTTQKRYEVMGIYTCEVEIDASGRQVKEERIIGLDGFRTVVTDGNGNVSTYYYNSKGQMIKMVDAEDHELIQEYDENGNLTLVDYPNQNDSENEDEDDKSKTTFTYEYYEDTDNIKVVTKIDGDGNRFVSTYDEAGNVMTEEDPKGNITRYEYDKLNHMTARISPMGMRTEYKYDAKGQVIEIREGDSVTIYRYDADGRMIFKTDAVGVSYSYKYDSKNRHTLTLDSKGRAVEKIKYDAAGNIIAYTDGNGYTTKYTYDALGNLLTEEDPEGNIQRNEYNKSGERTKYIDALGREASFEYDGNGNVTKIKDKAGKITEFTYDKNNRQISTIADAEGEKSVTGFEYDGMGNMVKVTMPDESHITSAYDHNNMVISSTDAEGNTEKRSYDENGNLISVTDGRGYTTIYEYDKDNRHVKTIDPLGTETRYIYDNQGRLAAVAAYIDGTEIISQRFTYDNAGRIICESNVLVADENDGSKENRVIYSYDERGRVSKKTLEDGESYVSYTYDGNGNVLTETYSSKEKSYTYKYKYNKNGQVVCVTDPMGGETRYTYTATGVVATETNAENGVTSYEYDANDNVISVTDPEGNSIVYKYDAQQRVTSVTDANRNEYRYEYDKAGNLTRGINPDGGVKTYTYNKNNQVIESVDEENAVTKYEYDENGNQTAVVDGNQNRTAFEYDALNRVTAGYYVEGTLRTNIAEYTYDALGRLSQVKDAEGALTKYEYDAKGRVIGEWDAYDNLRSYVYDPLDRVIEETDELGHTVRYEYDGLGNMTKYIDALGNTKSYKYDLNGNCLSSVDSLGGTYTYGYDWMNRLISETDPEKGTINYEYDLCGNLIKETNSKGYISEYKYDGNGNITQAKDAYENVTKVTYDSMNRPVDIRVHRIDKLNNIDQWQQTLYTYDHRGYVKTEANALDGKVLGGVKKYDYDANGNLVRSTDEENRTTTFGYDRFNNLASIKYADGKTVSYTYNKNGAMTEMKDWNGVTSIGVDKLGRVTSVTAPEGKKAEYFYDNAGNISEILYPDGNSVCYTYDYANRLKVVSDKKTGKIVDLDYDANGNVTTVEYGNKEAERYRYDKAGRVTKINEYMAGGSLRYSTQYSYDTEGNRTDIIRKSFGAGNAEEETKTEHYEYDALNRMVSSSDGKDTVLYTYDSVGNLVRERSSKGDTYYKYNGLNQLTSKQSPEETVTYKYDKRGNRISETDKKGTTNYSYDATGSLVQANTPDGKTSLYAYNGLGMRVLSETVTKGNYRDAVSKSYFVDFTSAENDDLYVEAKGAEEFAVRYIYAAGEKISQITSYKGKAEEKQLYIHEDIMGSTSYLTKNDGSIYGTVEFDPWGNPEISKELLSDNSIEINFTGHPYDKALGVYFAEARFYDPKTRVFMSVDPDKDGNNWYQYCASNPVNYWDPTGMSWWDDMTECFSAIAHEAEEVCDTVDEMVQHVSAEVHSKIQEWKEHPKEAALKLAVGMTTFAITAALATVTGGASMLLTGAILGALESGVDALLDESENGQPVNWKEVGMSALVGGVSGLIMGGAGTVALKAVKPLVFCGKTAGEVVSQVSARWAAGTVGNYVGGVVVNFSADLIQGKSFKESVEDTWNKRYDILADAAVMSLVNVATESVVAPRCFTAGTLVLTAEGLVAIEKVEAGDKVLAFAEETGEIAYKEVVQTFENTTDELTYVTVETEDGETETIESTPGHPYYVKEEKEFVKAYLLEEGTELTLADGRTAYVKEVVTEELTEPVAVYNFEVADFHTYYVGENRVLVHNAKGGCGKSQKSKTKKGGKKENEYLNAKQLDELNDLTEKLGEDYFNLSFQMKAFIKQARRAMKLHKKAEEETNFILKEEYEYREYEEKEKAEEMQKLVDLYEMAVAESREKVINIIVPLARKILPKFKFQEIGGDYCIRAPKGFRESKIFHNRAGHLEEIGENHYYEMDLSPNSQRIANWDGNRLVVNPKERKIYFYFNHFDFPMEITEYVENALKVSRPK